MLTRGCMKFIVSCVDFVLEKGHESDQLKHAQHCYTCLGNGEYYWTTFTSVADCTVSRSIHSPMSSSTRQLQTSRHGRCTTSATATVGNSDISCVDDDRRTDNSWRWTQRHRKWLIGQRSRTRDSTLVVTSVDGSVMICTVKGACMHIWKGVALKCCW